MLKKNLNKKLFTLVLSINERIERYFNFFKKKTSTARSLRFSNSVEKKIFIGVAILLFIVISYFLIPSFYDKNKIKEHLEHQILDKYNLNVTLDESLNCGLFP